MKPKRTKGSAKQMNGVKCMAFSSIMNHSVAHNENESPSRDCMESCNAFTVTLER